MAKNSVSFQDFTPMQEGDELLCLVVAFN